MPTAISRASGLIFFCALLVAVPRLAAAQAPVPPDPVLIVAGGFSTLQDETARARGGAVDLAWRVRRVGGATLAIVGDVGVNAFEGATVSSFLAGGRVWWSRARLVRPYGQFLAGLERCCGERARAVQVGGGMDVAIPGPLGVRVAYEYRRASYDEAVFNERRFWIGVAMGR